jgi:hypothetical protein
MPLTIVYLAKLLSGGRLSGIAYYGQSEVGRQAFPPRGVGMPPELSRSQIA